MGILSKRNTREKGTYFLYNIDLGLLVAISTAMRKINVPVAAENTGTPGKETDKPGLQNVKREQRRKRRIESKSGSIS